MTQYTYIIGLLTVIGLLLLADFRFKLAFYFDRNRTIKTLATAVGFFLIWDILGVTLGIFFPGDSRYTMHINILPLIRLEEIFFLSGICYLTLILWRLYEHLRSA